MIKIKQSAFSKAVQQYFRGYFDFFSQTKRRDYWWVMLGLALIWFLPFFYLLSHWVLAMLTHSALTAFNSIWLLLLFAILSVILIIPTLAMNMRRYRDAGLNGRGVLVLWLVNLVASRMSQGMQQHAWALIVALINVTLIGISLLATDRLVTTSDNPLVTFLFRRAS